MDSGKVLSLAQLSESFRKAKTRRLTGHEQSAHSVAWSCTGKRLASGSIDKTARIWVLNQYGRLEKDFCCRGHTDHVDQVGWHPSNDNLLASASNDHTVKFWDGRTGKCTQTVKNSGHNLYMAWAPSGNEMAVATKEDIIDIIDVRKGKVIKSTRFPVMVNEVSWNKTGDLFFLTTGSGYVDALRYPTLERVWVSHGHSAPVYCIHFDPTGRYFATGGADALVTLWDAENFVPVSTITTMEWAIRSANFSHDGQLIAVASEDHFIDISHVESGDNVHFVDFAGVLNTVAWHPQNYLLAYAGSGHDVQVFGFDPASASSECERS